MFTSRIRWFVLSLLFIATGLSFLDRQVLSIVIIKIQKEFDISDVEYGIINTGFLIGYAIMFTVAGRVIDLVGSKAGLAVSVGIWSIANCFHGVVNNFSPKNIEFAPAKKHKACNSSLIASLPAVKRITAFGIIILAVAIVRTNSKGSKSAVSPRGVPLIFTSILIGTLWGGSGKLANCWSKEILSSLDSPKA